MRATLALFSLFTLHVRCSLKFNLIETAESQSGGARQQSRFSRFRQFERGALLWLWRRYLIVGC
jgi:hypothetical protein